MESANEVPAVSSKWDPVIVELIDVLGGPAKTARAFRVNEATVFYWRTRRSPFPPALAPTAERLTREAGRVIACERLCPWVEWDVLRMQAGEVPAGEATNA